MSTYKVVETKNLPKEIPAGMAIYGIARTDGKKGKSGLAAVLPAVSDSVYAVLYADQGGKDWLYEAVATLRGKVASSLNKAGKEITDANIGVTALLEAMKESLAEGAGRIGKDSIGAWFDSAMAPLILAALEAKGILKGVAEKTVEKFRVSFQRLAVSDVTMPEAESSKLLKAFDLIPVDADEDVMAERLMVRLSDAIDRSKDDDGGL